MKNILSPRSIRVILTKPVFGAGKIGDIISIRKGFFKYLLHNQAALKHSKENIDYFAREEHRLQEEDKKLIDIANKNASSLDNDGFVIVRAVSESGRLYGRITVSEVQKAINNSHIKRNMISVPEIHTPGLFKVHIAWHPTVSSTILISVASTEKEAYENIKNAFSAQ